jgi:hypothetical protein
MLVGIVRFAIVTAALSAWFIYSDGMNLWVRVAVATAIALIGEMARNKEMA